MASNCCVPMCDVTKKRNPQISLHKFPAEPEKINWKTAMGQNELVSRQKLWINKLKIGKKISPYMRVCSLHFVEDDFFKVKQRKKLKKNAVPSVNLPQKVHGSISTLHNNCSTSGTNRKERLILRNRAKETVSSPITENLCNTHVEDETEVENEDELEAANALLLLMQTDVDTLEKKTFRDFQVQVNTPCKLTLCDFIKSDTSLKSLTGLNSFEMLNQIVSAVQIVYEDKRIHKLTIYQRIILSFVKLKWNLSYTILSVFFGLTSTSCKMYIVQMIKIISSVLKAAIDFPSMSEILRNMPICFEEFKDTQIVLDCTEIFTQIPKCLCCRIRFYSQYKNAQTIKFMTGVSPAGLITFISKPYGGRASDKIIFENSNLIEKLEKGSAIMVDKGFLIDTTCLLHNIKLYRPPFLRNKKQLDKNESIYNTKVAAARVHIERTNQRIKIFKILSGKFPWSLVHCVEDIFYIACGVTNLSAPILRDDKFLK